AVEGTLMGIAGREAPGVIEPALSARDGLGRPGELLELRLALRSELARMMGVNAGGREQSTGVCACELERTESALERRAGDHHLHDARGLGAREHRLAVGVVAVMREVDADVDQRGRRRGDGCR